MSLSSNQRRDQRRRLVLSWKRSAGPAGTPASDSPRSRAAYDPDALPEKQRGPAVLLPTGLSGLALAITAVLASLFAPIAAIAAYFLFKERLGRLQVAAVAVIVASVVALTVSVN